MGFVDSILVVLFMMAVVFTVLAVLFLIIRVFSIGIGLFYKEEEKVAPASIKAAEVVAPVIPAGNGDFSSGNLKLKDVDESSAAMIMAIVSDESGIPLSELCFKSIRLIHE
ncbi:MAG: OadG family protein [Clostridiales bacterium]|nr:OadG family protein [Clostridiales bacterium]